METEAQLDSTRDPRLGVLAAAIAGLLGLHMLVLALQGRIWWCACKGRQLWIGDIWSSHNSQHIFDPYTLSHILHGVIFFGLLWLFREKISLAWRWVMAVGIEVAWEIAENSTFVIDRYREATVALGYSGDSILNSLSDIGCCAFGFCLARLLGLRLSLLFFAVSEISMAIVYRDNLTLNVLMLLCPVDAIKQWQLGGAPS